MSVNFNLNADFILDKFETGTLNVLESKELLNRQDKKFIFHRKQLNVILSELRTSYQILKLKDSKIFNYKTIYYDTDNYDFYLQHHNGKQTRNKVRSRYYKESNKTFFEIKSKTNKSKTIKNRILLNKGEDGIIDFQKRSVDDSNEQSYTVALSLLKNYPEIKPEKLIPILSIIYKRMTFMHKFNKEKVTLDYDLSVNNIEQLQNTKYELQNVPKISDELKLDLNNLVIAETKQERLQGMSDFEQIMNNFQIRSCSFSKYCTAIIILEPEIKHNRFKRKINYINKISRNNNGL